MKKYLFLLLATASAFAATKTNLYGTQVVGTESFENLLTNPSWEQNANNWTASGGSYARTTTAAQISRGNAAASWDSSGASQTLVSTAVSIPDGMKGRDAVGYCDIKAASGTATHTLQAYDGTNVLFSKTITSDSSYFRKTEVNFVMPTSGNIQLRLVSVAADEVAIYVDNCYLGLATNIGEVSQAKVIVNARRSISDQNIASTGETTVVFNSESLDLYNEFSTSTGIYTATAPRRLYIGWQFSVINLATSEGLIGRVRKGGSPVCDATFYTSASAVSGIIFSNSPCVVDVVAGDTLTISLDSSADASYDVQNSLATFVTITEFPTDVSRITSFENAFWKVDANISTPATHFSLTNTSYSSYVDIGNASGVLVNNAGTGNIAAEIPCSSTNPPTGTTCSAGSEVVGVAFTPQGQFPQDVLACVSFSHYVDNAAASSVETVFQIVETSTTSQTVIQEGKSRFGSGSYIANGVDVKPLRVCGNFTFSSGGKKVLKLFFEQSVSGTPDANLILSDGSVSLGQRDIHWEVYPIQPSNKAPVLIGSVTSNSTGAERVERARVAGTATATTNCTSSPCTVHRQSGSWISSVTRNSTGDYTINFASGIFSGPPSCSGSALNGANTLVLTTNGATTATATTVNSLISTSASTTDSYFDIICMGPR